MMQKWDPKTTVFVFPGQGSQALGMGADLYQSGDVGRLVFEEVSDIVGYNIADVIFGSDQSELLKTKNAQIAILSVSIAALRFFMMKVGRDIANVCCGVAGHSVGQYSAFCAADVFSMSDAVRLLSARGDAMDSASGITKGSMLALIGGDQESIQRLIASAAKDEVLVVANYNSQDQNILSGALGAIDRASEMANDFGFKRAVRLNVAGAFHSPLMSSAKGSLKEAVDKVVFDVPKVPIVENTSAVFEVDPERLKKLLVNQMDSSVRWLQSIAFLRQKGVKTIVEFGHGKVLSGLMRRIDSELEVISISDVAGVESILMRFE